MNYVDNDEDRLNLIEQVLPTESLIETYLYPVIEMRLFNTLAGLVKEEVEIYRAYPKRSGDLTKEMKKTFDPRNNETCFMGKGFKSNDHITDAELHNYRKRVGTINHPVWGNCTLLEIWAGDHFKDHEKMVRAVFRYAMGGRKTRPTIKFHINPLIATLSSGRRKMNEEQKKEKDDLDDLIQRALVFGVRSPAEAQRERTRKRKLNV